MKNKGGCSCIVAGLMVVCILCIAQSLSPIVKAVVFPTLRPTPLVRIGAYPIQDVDSYAVPGLVLWDLSHSKDPEWDWHKVSDDDEIRDYMETQGYKFDLNKVGVLNLDISSYSLIVLELGCCVNKSTYTSEEAEILFDYVNSGGSLLLFGENAGLDESQNLNVVSQKFGIELASGNIYYSIQGFDRFAKHPVTDAVYSLSFQGAGTIGVVPPATPVAWHVEQATGNPVEPIKESIIIAVAEIGKGKVVAVGDSDFIKKEYLGNFEKRFILNTFDWLTQE